MIPDAGEQGVYPRSLTRVLARRRAFDLSGPLAEESTIMCNISLLRSVLRKYDAKTLARIAIMVQGLLLEKVENKT